MKSITIVTGNAYKLEEWQQQWPLNIELLSRDINLTEEQGTPEYIVTQKVKQAFDIVKSSVIVEDVAAGLDRLNGAPGPYVKDLIERLKEAGGEHSRDGLFALAKKSGEAATAHCITAYYDGTQLLTAVGTVHGTVVKPRGKRGFGFDFCFIPEGESRTWAEMSLEEKAKTSHRAKAIRLLADKLSEL